MKSIYLSILFLFICISMKAQDFIYFDKKFKRVKDYGNSRYKANFPNSEQPSRVFDRVKGVQYAFGIINDADTLSFEGKISFFDSDGDFTGFRFYKKGREMPLIKINAKLQRVVSSSNEYYVIASEEGEFCAYQRYESGLGFLRERIYATGKITDITMNLDSIIVFYNEKAKPSKIKIYEKGVEIPFLATTGDLKQPYEIIKIVTHTAVGYSDAESELETFKVTCKLLGADAAIGVHTSISVTPVVNTDNPSSNSKIIIQGTAIKFRKKE